MTVRGEIDRSIAMAAAAKGNYLLFATESADDTAQNVFQDMADDMERHVKILRSRLDYLDQYNQLNASVAGGNNQQQGGQGNGQQNKGSQNQNQNQNQNQSQNQNQNQNKQKQDKQNQNQNQ